VAAIDLRPYQAPVPDRLRARYRAGAHRLLLVAPTGSGKTVMAGSLVLSARSKARRVLFVAHRHELLDQPRRLLQGCGLRVGIVKAGVRPDPEAPVQIASIQTLARRGDLPPADLVIVDEAHRAAAASYAHLRHYPAWLGLTATPWRLDGQGLGEQFDELIEVARPSQLVADGWILDPRVFAPAAPAMPARARDYTRAELSDAMDRGDLIGDVVTHWQRHAAGRPTVCFASTIRHSLHLVERFISADIFAEHIDGTTPAAVRADILERLATGVTKIVSNVDIITEGFDLPALSCAIVARPTTSLTKHLQMCGRIVRPDEGKVDCVLLDHAGNSLRHGLPCEDHQWTLDGREKRGRTDAVRVCSYCFAANPPRKKNCIECGEPFPVHAEPRRLKRERSGELAERRRERRRAEPLHRKQIAFRQLLLIAEQKGRHPGWAVHVYRGRYGEEPPR
jgi:superfamily II DNA or RNA helicase